MPEAAGGEIGSLPPLEGGVTTVVPVYNGARYLGEALDSLAAQTRPADRVVVIDDASTDGTAELVRGHPRLDCHLLRNPRRLGLFPNMNRALQLAPATRYLHLLHADDRLHPAFLEEMVRALEDCEAPSFSLCRTEEIGPGGERTGGPPGEGAQGFAILSRRDFLARMSELRPSCCAALVIRCGGQPLPFGFRPDFPHLADVVFYAQLAAQARSIRETRRVLCQMRVHPESATARHVRRIGPWVADEWRAMETILPWIPEGGLARWTRRQKLRCLFAARSRVKERMFLESDPVYSRDIDRAVRERVPRLHRLLGRLAVRIRDLARGPLP